MKIKPKIEKMQTYDIPLKEYKRTLEKRLQKKKISSMSKYKSNLFFFFQYFNVPCKKSKSTEKSTLINIYSPFFGKNVFFSILFKYIMWLFVKKIKIFSAISEKYSHAEEKENLGGKLTLFCCVTLSCQQYRIFSFYFLNYKQINYTLK